MIKRFCKKISVAGASLFRRITATRRIATQAGGGPTRLGIATPRGEGSNAPGVAALATSAAVVLVVALSLWSLASPVGTLMEEYNMNSEIYLSQILPLLSLVAVAMLCFSRRRVTLNRIDATLALLIIILALNRGTLPWNREMLLTMLSIYIVTRIVVAKSEYGVEMLCGVLLLVSILESFLALREMFGLIPSNHTLFPFTGSLPNPGPLCGLLAMIFPLPLWMVLRRPLKAKALIAIIAGGMTAVLAFFVLSTGESRTAILATAAGSTPILWQWWREQREKRSQIEFQNQIQVKRECVAQEKSEVLKQKQSDSHIESQEKIQNQNQGERECVALGKSEPLNQKESDSQSERPRQKLKSRRKLPLLVALSIAIAVGLIALLIALRPESALGRVLLWRCSLSAIMRAPLTGVGAGRFSHAYGVAQSDYLASPACSPEEIMVADVPHYAFNEYLQIGIEGGVIATILFILLIGCIIKRAHRSPHPLARPLLGSTIAFAIFALASYPLQVLPLCTIAIILAATVASLPEPSLISPESATQHNSENNPHSEEAPHPTPPTPHEQQFSSLLQKLLQLTAPLTLHAERILPALFTIVAVAISIYIHQNPIYRESDIAKWRVEKRYYDMELYRGTVDNYRELYPTFRYNYALLFEFGNGLSKTAQYEESDAILLEGLNLLYDPMFTNILGKNAEARGDYDLAESYFQESLHILPNRVYPQYLLFELYLERDDTTRAIIAGEELLAKRAKVESSAVEKMREDVRKRLKYIKN